MLCASLRRQFGPLDRGETILNKLGASKFRAYTAPGVMLKHVPMLEYRLEKFEPEKAHPDDVENQRNA